MLKLLLIRTKYTQEYVEGWLVNQNTNEVLCHTLEDKYRDLSKEEKVYGETSIPLGKYEIKSTFSPKFQKETIELQDVPHFKYIRMHWAASINYLEGCIGVGEKNGLGVLKNTNMTDKLVELIKEYDNIGEIKII